MVFAQAQFMLRVSSVGASQLFPAASAQPELPQHPRFIGGAGNDN
jgi:hypothetical protein